MRLAEAIRMGSLLIPEPRLGHLPSCALGMAAKACGLDVQDNASSYNTIVVRWPWIANVYSNCPACVGLGEIRGTMIVWHPFDRHVMGDKSMTLEQLCDFIESIDPTPKDSRTTDGLPLQGRCETPGAKNRH